jgi:hypothetical protein
MITTLSLNRSLQRNCKFGKKSAKEHIQLLLEPSSSMIKLQAALLNYMFHRLGLHKIYCNSFIY